MNKINGDIFKGKWNGMAHGCNLHANMGAGIAKEVKRIFPQAFKADQEAVAVLGHFSAAYSLEFNSGFVDVFNLYSQKGIGNNGTVLGRNARYDAINDGLFRICEDIMFGRVEAKKTRVMDSMDNYVLALPEIGCGLAGGERVIIHSIMESVELMFPEIDFDLYIYP